MGCRAALRSGLESRGNFFDDMQATVVRGGRGKRDRSGPIREGGGCECARACAEHWWGGRGVTRIAAFLLLLLLC